MIFCWVVNYELRETNIGIVQFGSSCFCRSVLFDWLDTTSWPRKTYAFVRMHAFVIRTHIKLPKYKCDEKPEIRLAMSISSLIKHTRLAYNNTILQLLLREMATTFSNWFPYCFELVLVLFVLCFSFFIICLRGLTHLMKYERIMWKRKKEEDGKV